MEVGPACIIEHNQRSAIESGRREDTTSYQHKAGTTLSAVLQVRHDQASFTAVATGYVREEGMIFSMEGTPEQQDKEGAIK